MLLVLVNTSRICFIDSITVSASSGSISLKPTISSVMMFPPVRTNSGRDFAMVSTISLIDFLAVAMRFSLSPKIPLTRLAMIFVPDSISFGKYLLINLGIFSTIWGSNVSMSFPMPSSTVSTRGMIFLPTCDTVTTTLSMSLSRSASSSASPVNRLLHAALAAAIEPCIVSAASRFA